MGSTFLILLSNGFITTTITINHLQYIFTLQLHLYIILPDIASHKKINVTRNENSLWGTMCMSWYDTRDRMSTFWSIFLLKTTSRSIFVFLWLCGCANCVLVSAYIFITIHYNCQVFSWIFWQFQYKYESL